MPDSLRKLGLDLADTKLLDSVDWVVTEKIHGANFSFSLEGDVLRYAKRKEFLRWTDDFFGFQLVAERLDTALECLRTRGNQRLRRFDVGDRIHRRGIHADGGRQGQTCDEPED